MRDNDEEEEGNGLFTLKRASFGMYYFVASSIAIALLCDFAYSATVEGFGDPEILSCTWCSSVYSNIRKPNSRFALEHRS